MDKLSLAALLDEDREMVMANLAGDRSLSEAQEALEKAIDRVMYRYVEGCRDEALRDGAQYILQAVKNTLPMMDTVGEARAWQKQYAPPGRKGLHLKPMALALLVGGLVFVWAAVLGTLIAGGASGAMAFVKALLPVTLGCAALFWAGAQSAKPGRGEAPAAPDAVRTEYLVDGEKAWHCLRGALVQADGQLERIREADALLRQEKAGEAAAGRTDPATLELLAELLESAYAAGDDGARESASSIRFYLHNAGIDALDFEPGRESWFEFLPAARPGTIRPALATGGKLLKKGLASASPARR